MKISTYLRKTLSLFVSLTLLCASFVTVSYADDYSYDLYAEVSQNSDEITNIAPLASVSAKNQATYGPTTALSNINDGLPLSIKSGYATGQYAAYEGKTTCRAVIRFTSDDKKSILTNTIKSDDNTHFIARIEFKFDSEYEISGYKVYASIRDSVTADGVKARVDGRVVSSYNTKDVNIKEHTYAALYAAVYEHPKMTLSNSVITDSFTIDYEVPYTYANSTYTPGQAWLTEIEIYGKKPTNIALASKGTQVSATNSYESVDGCTNGGALYGVKNLIDGLDGEAIDGDTCESSQHIFKSDVTGEASKVTLSLPEYYSIHTLKVTELSDSQNKIASMKVSANGTDYDTFTTVFDDTEGKATYVLPLNQTIDTYNLDLTFTPADGKNITLYEIEAYGNIKGMDNIQVTEGSENLALLTKNTVISATNSYEASGDCSCDVNEFSKDNLIDNIITSDDTHLVNHVFKSDEAGEDVTLTFDYQNKAELTDVVIVEMRDTQNALSEFTLSTLTDTYDTLDVSTAILGKKIYHHLKLSDIIETNKLLITLTPAENKGIVLYEVMTYGTEIIPVEDINISSTSITNIALGKKPTVSLPALYGLSETRLTDGNHNWSSSRYVARADSELVITFDLEKTHFINEVIVVERADTSREHSTGEQFTLEVGQVINGQTIWQVVNNTPLNFEQGSLPNGVATDIKFDSVNASKVRLTMQQTSSTKYQFEFSEIEIYGYENPKADFSYLSNVAKRKPVTSNVASGDLGNVTDTKVNTSLTFDTLDKALELTLELKKPMLVSYMSILENKPNNETNADKVKIEFGSKKGNELVWKTIKDGISLNDADETKSSTFLNISEVASVIKFTFANSDGDYSDGISIEDISVYGEELPYSTFISKPQVKLVQNSKEVIYNQLDDSLILDIVIDPLYTKENNGIDALAIISVYDALSNELKQITAKNVNIGSKIDKISLETPDTWTGKYIDVSIIDNDMSSALTSSVQFGNVPDIEPSTITQEGSSCEIDYVTGNVKVEIKLSGVRSGVYVPFVDLNPSYEYEDVVSISQPSAVNALCHYKYLVTDKDGVITYTYKPSNAKGGEHKLFYVSPVTNEVVYVSNTYTFYDSETKLDVLNEFNDATSWTQIKEKLNTYHEIFGIETLDSENIDTISKCIYKDKGIKKLSKTSDLVDAYNLGISIAKLNEAQDSIEFIVTLEEEGLLEDFEKLPAAELIGYLTDDEDVIAIYDAILDKEYEHIYDVEEAFTHEVILKIVYKGKNSTYVESAILNNTNYLKGLNKQNLAKLNMQAGLTSVTSKLIHNSFDSIETFIQRVNSLVNTELNKLNKDPGGSKPSFDSGFGGGNKVIDAPIDTPVVNPSLVFTDMSASMWAADSVKALVDLGVINGKAPNTFAPNEYITREEFVKIIVEAFNLNTSRDANFNDVSSDSWYSDYIKRAVASNIINGISSNEFGVGRFITREDIAVILQRALSKEMNLNQTQNIFNDNSDISSYAKDSISKLVNSGIITGFTDNTFKPKANATRAEAAVMVYRALNFKGGIK